MNYEDDVKMTLDLILEWAENTPWFDASVFIGFAYYYEDYNKFTYCQKQEIYEFYSKWKSSIWHKILFKRWQVPKYNKSIKSPIELQILKPHRCNYLSL